jgi:hypothetical protein
MRHAAPLGTLAGMNQQRVILNAEIDHSVIRGTLTAADGEHRAFHGWLELSTALEALLAPTDSPALTRTVSAEGSAATLR